MQPHHHISIWTVAVLTVILTATNFTSVTLQASQQSGPGPNQETKEFFGEDDEGENGPDDIPECRQDFSGPMPSESYTYSPSPGETVPGNPSEAPSGYPSNSPTPTETNFNPVESQKMMSAECKAAIIKLMKSRMGRFYAKMKDGSITAKLDKVLSIIDKLETKDLATLKAAGIDTSQIEPLLPKIAADIKSLKDFFQMMTDLMGQFLGIDDPDQAFEFMDKRFPNDKTEAMVKVADRLVSNIKKLQSLLKAITDTQGGDRNGVN